MLSKIDPERISVFWAPGCTSCALIKSYLEKKSIPYDSFDIQEDPWALEFLHTQGIRSIPVVFYHDQYVLGEILDNVIEFLGFGRAQNNYLKNLDQIQNIRHVLDDINLRSRDLSESQQYHKFVGLFRRTTLDHLFHIAIIVRQGLIEALIKQQTPLLFDHYIQRMPADWSVDDLQKYIDQTQKELSTITDEMLAKIDSADTFFGKASPSQLIKRTNEHACQHYLQFYYILKYFDLDSTIPSEITLPLVVEQMHDVAKHTIFDL